MKGSCTFGEKARRHPCSRWHRDLVAGYRETRERQELELEAITSGYEADRRLYFELGAPPLITFKDWLIAHAGGAA